MVYDLGERTAKFGEVIIRFCKNLPYNENTRILTSQLIRAATSVGANYCEADNASSKKDFKYKIGICNREAKETMYWLRMIAAAAPQLKEEIRKYWREVHELNLIFSAIINKK
ncbi:MAG: four helix bundle protein [Patescibacteria group bacterium]|jgi:four helix bundle protein